MHSHPIVGGAIVLALVAYVLRFDAGSVLLSIAPTAAVIVGYWLAQRTRKQGIADAADAVKRAEEAAQESSKTLGEVHVLVNSQKDELERLLAVRDTRIAGLESQLATLLPAPQPT